MTTNISSSIKAGYSKAFFEAHREEITLHKAAKQAFSDLGVEKLPTVKQLNEEYAELLARKKEAYREYRKAKQEMTDFANEGFEPYMSEKSAERSRKSWEKFFSELAVIEKSWRYQLGGVMPVTDAMFWEMEEQLEKEYEIISKIKSPVAEALEKSLKKELRRKNFKVIK